MSTAATHSASYNAQLTLRVDVQNAAGRVQAPLTIRTSTPTSIAHVHELLQSALANALNDDEDDNTHANAIDVEVYDARKDKFLPLHSLTQLAHRRARLNVILHNARSGDCLALPSKIFDSSAFMIAGVPVHVGEVGNSGQGTGLTTWDGSVVLAKYLEHARVESVRGKRVLELGAGTGLVGLSAALLGAQEVVLTDLAYTMDNLARNVAQTLSDDIDRSRVSTRVLDWFDPPTDLGSFDVVLASDVVWVEELIPPLVATFATVLRHSVASAKVLMAHQHRSVVSDALLFAELERHGLVKQRVSPRDLHPQFTSERIDVWEISRSSDVPLDVV